MNTGVLQKSNKISEVTVEEYDSFDQVIKSTNQTTGLVTETEYDKNGNVTKTSDNGGKVTTHEYDELTVRNQAQQIQYWQSFKQDI